MSVNDTPPVVNQPVEDLMGYANATELAKAKRSTDAELHRIKAERDQLAAERAQLYAQPQQAGQRRSPEEELEAQGISPTVLDRYFDDRFGRALQPLAQQISGQAEGRSEMLNTHGDDYVQYEAKVATHLESDPRLQQRYQRMFTADPAGAMDWAFRHYSDTKRAQAGERVRGDRSQQTEASMPSARTGEGPPNAQSQGGDLVNRAREHFEKTGNAVPFAKARLRQAISDEFLNQ